MVPVAPVMPMMRRNVLSPVSSLQSSGLQSPVLESTVLTVHSPIGTLTEDWETEDRISSSSRVQAPDLRLRALHVVRRARRSQRRNLLQLRPTKSWPLGLRARLARARADLGFVPFVIGTCSVLYALTLLPLAATSA